MISWLRDQIEAWHNRRSSRTAETQSLALPFTSTGNSINSNTMFMSSSDPTESFTVIIISLEGNAFPVTVESNSTIDAIKRLALIHFYGENMTKPTSCYRLIHSATFKQLVDDQCIGNDDINAYDELLLVEIKSVSVHMKILSDTINSPNVETIIEATRYLPDPIIRKPVMLAGCSVDDEFRKTLITLTRTSAKILMYTSNAENLFKFAQEMLERNLTPVIDPANVKILVDMGYPHHKVIKALSVQNYHYSRTDLKNAMQWLTEYSTESDDDDYEVIDESTEECSTSSSTKKIPFEKACTEFLQAGQKNERERNLIKIIELLLKCFRRHRKIDFKPDEKALRMLMEMGFEEELSKKALKITGNNTYNTCQWLLGDRDPSLQDLDANIDANSLIYKGLMNNPKVQLSLTNPRMLVAYLSILEVPMMINAWLADPEISPTLSYIIKIYNAEKYAQCIKFFT